MVVFTCSTFCFNCHCQSRFHRSMHKRQLWHFARVSLTLLCLCVVFSSNFSTSSLSVVHMLTDVVVYFTVSILMFLFLGRPTHYLFLPDTVTHWVIVKPFFPLITKWSYTILALFFGSALALFKKGTSFFLTSGTPFEKSSPKKMVFPSTIALSFLLLLLLP